MTDDNHSRESIAVIGGGPGAMFLCHAIEVQRNELLKRGEDVSDFPIVQCFERAPGPGGVWRSDRSHENEHDAQNAEATGHFDSNVAGNDAMDAEASSFAEEKKDEHIPDVCENNKRQKIEEEQGNLVEARSSDRGEKTPNMYSALWTNGPKEAFEFSDYTFRDHFGDVRMPAFLPRKYVLDYILARCTRNCPNFFEKFFSFRTSVVNVRYVRGEGEEYISEHSTENKFRVHTRNEITGIEEFKIFDKCVWMGGMNGIPYTPTKLVNLFKDGGFKGSIIHSSDTTNFKKDVENKRILIVGGGYSAEDLAIMAIKEGVSRVYCTFRGDTEKEMTWTTRWPYDKVETHSMNTIVKVEGSTVTLEAVFKDYYEDDYKRYTEEEKPDKTVLNDIDTVIFCTGYEPNLNMLDQLLRDAYDGDDDSDCGLTMPKDWKMEDTKAAEAILGKDHKLIKPSKTVYPSDDFANCWYDLYRGCVLIENPNMMYSLNNFSDTPLMETDITAWMLARYVTGQKALPSADEMHEENKQISFDCMQNFHLRYKMDRKFNKAIDKAVDGGMSEEASKLWLDAENQMELYQYRLLGNTMNDTGYPVSLLSKDGKSISELGEKIQAMHSHDKRHMMHKMKYKTSDDTDIAGTEGEQKGHHLPPGWMTFRDNPNEDYHVSYFTGIKACHLPKPWLELNENDKLW